MAAQLHHLNLREQRTLSGITRFLRGASLVVVDIGGGPGAYATWLVKQGHSESLLDPLSLHEEQAKQQGVDAVLGDARKLPYADASAEVALMLGPLYHLRENEDRRKALEEAKRVLKPGGIIVAAAISRHPTMLDLLVRNQVDDEEYLELR